VWGSACLLRVRKGPYRALDHMDRAAGSSSWIPAHDRLEPCVVGVHRSADSKLEGVAIRTVQGTGLDQRFQMDLGHRPYRLGHRTPVLYSRNQSRTNIALSKKLDRRGRVSLPSCSM